MSDYWAGTKIDGDYTNQNPLRKRLERFRHEKFSENTWRKIQSVWERQVQNDWIVSGGSMFDDWLDMHGLKYLQKISRDMDMKREFYYGY